MYNRVAKKLIKKIEDTELPRELPTHAYKDVWRVWVYWLKEGRWDGGGAPNYYATEVGWRRQWVPKQRKNNSYFRSPNLYRRIVVEKLESSGWIRILDQVDSSDDSTWKLEDAE